jgi:hypothetical protein
VCVVDSVPRVWLLCEGFTKHPPLSERFIREEPERPLVSGGKLELNVEQSWVGPHILVPRSNLKPITRRQQ